MLTLFVALILGGTAQPTTDNDPPNTHTTTVSIPTTGYDFANPRDVARFDRQARTIITERCGEASNVDLVGQRLAKACRTTALAAMREARDQRIAAATNRPTRTASHR